MTTFEVTDRNLNIEKLEEFGFCVESSRYVYNVKIADGEFEMFMYIEEGFDKVCISSTVIDILTGEEYVLHEIPGAHGNFLDNIRAEVERITRRILEECFGIPRKDSKLKNRQTAEVISYAREKYGDEAEFLWEKFPDCAVLRRKDTKKWYAAILTTGRAKFGYDNDETIEVLDLKETPETIATLVDNTNFFPGYHMNKKHWYTIILDGRIEKEEIFERIDTSHELVGPKKASKQ